MKGLSWLMLTVFPEEVVHTSRNFNNSIISNIQKKETYTLKMFYTGLYLYLHDLQLYSVQIETYLCRKLFIYV